MVANSNSFLLFNQDIDKLQEYDIFGICVRTMYVPGLYIEGYRDESIRTLEKPTRADAKGWSRICLGSVTVARLIESSSIERMFLTENIFSNM